MTDVDVNDEYLNLYRREAMHADRARRERDKLRSERDELLLAALRLQGEVDACNADIRVSTESANVAADDLWNLLNRWRDNYPSLNAGFSTPPKSWT